MPQSSPMRFVMVRAVDTKVRRVDTSRDSSGRVTKKPAEPRCGHFSYARLNTIPRDQQKLARRAVVLPAGKSVEARPIPGRGVSVKIGARPSDDAPTSCAQTRIFALFDPAAWFEILFQTPDGEWRTQRLEVPKIIVIRAWVPHVLNVSVTDYAKSDPSKKAHWLQSREQAWGFCTSYSMEGAPTVIASGDPGDFALRRFIIWSSGKFEPAGENPATEPSLTWNVFVGGIVLAAETMGRIAGTVCLKISTVNKMPAWPRRRHFWHARLTLPSPTISHPSTARRKKLRRFWIPNHQILSRAECERAVRTASNEHPLSWGNACAPYLIARNQRRRRRCFTTIFPRRALCAASTPCSHRACSRGAGHC